MGFRLSDDDLLAALDDACGQSTCGLVCGWCGRTHFCDEDDCYQQYLEEMKAAPDKYCLHEGYSPWFEWDGKETVVGCPCQTDLKIGRLLWGGRGFVSSLFQRCAARAIDGARVEIKEAERVSGSVAKAVKKTDELK